MLTRAIIEEAWKVISNDMSTLEHERDKIKKNLNKVLNMIENMEEQVTDITPQGEKVNESPEHDIAPLEDRYNLSIQLELELIDTIGSGDILAHKKESKTQTKKKM